MFPLESTLIASARAPLPDGLEGLGLQELKDRAATGWLAKLELDFYQGSQGKTLLGFKHQGPLRIQKALYPEGPAPCHAIIVHPPGGIASGDCLTVAATVQAESHGLVTTPSAAKWYGAYEHQAASQLVELTLEGAFEWLPQETIVFDRARVESAINIRASAQASMIGWDHLIFGRKASGESFATGRFAQSLRLWLDDELVWHDRLLLQGSDPLFGSMIGLHGYHAFATLWALQPASKPWSEVTLTTLREAAPQVAWTMLHPRLVVGRLLAPPLSIRTNLLQAWGCLRPQVFSIPAHAPRLWAT